MEVVEQVSRDIALEDTRIDAEKEGPVFEVFLSSPRVAIKSLIRGKF